MGSATSKQRSPARAPAVGTGNEEKTLSRNLSLLSLNTEATPQSSDGTLSLSNLVSWERTASADPKIQLARTILSHSNIRTALTSRQAYIADRHVFNTEIEFKTGPVTNQKSSGRCWLFATTNVLRYDVMKKLKLKEFQFSQSYLFFYDKLNKANYYLELSMENAHLPLDDRLVYFLSKDIINDGGQWDMVVNLLETYGLIPQALFPESLHSSLSGPLNTLLKTKLREHALILRRLHASLYDQVDKGKFPEHDFKATLRAKKEELMQEVYTIMSATLGTPPRPDERFTWEYYADGTGGDGHAKVWEGTPREFYAQFTGSKYKPSDSFSLIHDPRNEFGKLYTVDKLGNVWGGRPVLYVNTEIDNLKSAVVKMIQAGHPVFFGCDVGQFSDSKAGVMDTALFEYENAFNIQLGLTKAERLQVNETAMTHAMVISGVHVDPASGKPVRYKVENSWGEGSGEKGYFVMSDKWFEEFVFQVVVPKTLASKELVRIFEEGNKIVLPPWDPMGSLA